MPKPQVLKSVTDTDIICLFQNLNLLLVDHQKEILLLNYLVELSFDYNL